MSEKDCESCEYWERDKATKWGLCWAPVPEWVEVMNSRSENDGGDCEVYESKCEDE